MNLHLFYKLLNWAWRLKYSRMLCRRWLWWFSCWLICSCDICCCLQAPDLYLTFLCRDCVFIYECPSRGWTMMFWMPYMVDDMVRDILCVIYLSRHLLTCCHDFQCCHPFIMVCYFTYNLKFILNWWNSFIIMPTRSRQLTEKGFDLLERNLGGKCKSGIRSATTVANKLGPLLQDENVEIECIKSYLTELEQRVSAIVDSQICYDDKFADYPDILADFYEWFQPRFDTLCSVLSYTREFVSTCNVNMADSPLENVDNDFHTDHADNDIRPEDSVSQVSRSHHGRRSVSRTSRSSKVSSKTSSKASSHVSSIKSARIKESLRKVSLLAESQTLAKKQDLMRKELETFFGKRIIRTFYKFSCCNRKRGGSFGCWD